MWREQSECREHNMTQKLSDSHYVRNKERTSLLPLKCLQIIFFFLSEDFSVYMDDVVNWLKNNNSRTSMKRFVDIATALLLLVTFFLLLRFS